MTASPCINICEIDPKTNICIGCGRTMKEIANWINLSVEEKKRLLLELKKR
jgi:predicted Fe-S protein YdhL (DUF1289 family)